MVLVLSVLFGTALSASADTFDEMLFELKCKSSMSEDEANGNKQTVFTYLVTKLGYNSAVACGIMANIEKESSFNPAAYNIDTNGKPSGGICQWNGSRYNAMIAYCGVDWKENLAGQLEYLNAELEGTLWNGVIIHTYMKTSVSNDATGAYDAGYYWCYYFEIPANREIKSVERGNLARDSYWPIYGKPPVEGFPEKPVLTVTQDDEGKAVFSWVEPENAGLYKLNVWNAESVCTEYADLTGSEFSAELETGDYRAQIIAININFPDYVTNGDEITFNIKEVTPEKESIFVMIINFFIRISSSILSIFNFFVKLVTTV